MYRTIAGLKNHGRVGDCARCVGLLRAYNWVQSGASLFGQGLLLVPFVGVMAVARGVFISIVALLYVLFAIGVFLGKGWAWWPRITAVIINLFLVVGALVQGVPLIEGIAWSVIPAVSQRIREGLPMPPPL